MQIENKVYNGRKTTAKIDGIQFNNISVSGIAKDAIMSRTYNTWRNESDANDTWYPGINAVDIDWNEAVLPHASTNNGGEIVIKTTGELLDLIDKMQDEIYVLTAAVIALSQG